LDMALKAKVALEALAHFGRPEIVNPDQGSQSTGAAFTGTLASAAFSKPTSLPITTRSGLTCR